MTKTKPLSFTDLLTKKVDATDVKQLSNLKQSLVKGEERCEKK